MRINRRSSLRDVAFIVCTALHEAGIEAVLTGGSAATVYAPRAYQSHDIDFVITFQAQGSLAKEVLLSLGYREARDHYEHDKNALILEFPRGPLAIGGTLITQWHTLRDGRKRLHIISPTDSCRDRLAGFMFWNDRGSLEQAIAVARARQRAVDMAAIRRWCRAEGKAEAFDQFESALATSK